MPKEIKTGNWPDGTLYWECEFENGVENGKFRSWHDEGKPWEEGQFVNGKRNGTWKMWSGDGISESTLEMVDDVAIHIVKTIRGRVVKDEHYDRDGNVIERPTK
jgi:antitoxin component YwqK of YwqJK toxin-antitoxin module